MFDTGSDLSWIPCSTCRECEAPKKLLFDPTESSTYSSIRCNSDECSQAQDSSSCSTESNTCRFAISYADGTITEGSIIRDTLTLAPFDVLPNFVFGCSDYYSMKHRAVGLIGLSREKVSLFSQVSQKYGEVFSYCIPSSLSSTGYLAFGRLALPPHIKYTPMLTMPPVVGLLYFVRLAGIKVAGKTLPLPPTVFSRTATAIDSGGVITRLPPLAYNALRSEFQKHMTEYTLMPHKFVVDTCYDMSGHKNLNVPTVELLFDGGASLSLDFDGTMIMADDQMGCLAFTATDDMHGGVSIIGNTQQKKYTVVYDVTNGKVGFGSGGCA
ncbi:Protein ASPARTIC PROTEASE IN GUARD CELL 2 [Ananas comosus]|uniref:Protein ASPARTIC PROTEASE IN GUARD CELL 2 n=2 Tax=Ananas comosus TaxID=4615 RepID=A0A199VDF6_ANACO|nr:Protein ASPARTIC PROTEASE IN GUARD CELL 2 [Ananas comosus]